MATLATATATTKTITITTTIIVRVVHKGAWVAGGSRRTTTLAN